MELGRRLGKSIQVDSLMMFNKEALRVFPASTGHAIRPSISDALPLNGTVSEIPEACSHGGEGVTCAIRRLPQAEIYIVPVPLETLVPAQCGGSLVSVLNLPQAYEQFPKRVLSMFRESMIWAKFKCQSCSSQYSQQSRRTRHIKGSRPQESQRVVERKRRRGGQSNAGWQSSINYCFRPNRRCKRSRYGCKPNRSGFDYRD